MQSLLRNIARVLLPVMMIIIWSVAIMVFTDKFPPHFGFLETWLAPWKKLATIPEEAGLGGRMAYMQSILDSSRKIAETAFSAMVLSFGLLSIYLTYLYQQKQRRVRENTLLTLKNDEIARRNEFIRYISATINHEFKNSLGRIKRRIDLLPVVPPDMKERLDRNMQRLFADIEVFKKISDEREASLFDFKGIDISRMLAALPAQYGDLADIRVECGGPMRIFASRTLLKTVFENLMDNSIKYKKHDQGRARVYISCYEEFDGKRRYASISFKDEGLGIDEEQADGCFYKGRSSAENGWGQGLYFVKYAVGLHAGKVRVGSEYTAPGRGTEIIINLPYIEESINV